MKYIGFNGLNMSLAKLPTAWGIQVDFIKGIFQHRRGWAAFSLLARTGKAWSVNMMILGLWISCYLHMPLMENGEDISISKRKITWGFNFFQSVNGIVDDAD